MIRSVFLLLAALLSALPALAGEIALDRAAVLAHGPWPPSPRPDPTNRVADSPAAIALGQMLFGDPRLSGDGTMPCTRCHDPDRAFTDGKSLAVARKTLSRNTPTILGVGLGRWFGWDGAGDSLWAASIRPILNADEMAGSLDGVARLLREDQTLHDAYVAAFGRPPDHVAPEMLLADAGKALAAWQALQMPPRTAFDRFRDAMAVGDTAGMSDYPVAAQRGLAIFTGKGRCSLCHAGPAFTNGEFADAGVPFFTAEGADRGRFGGIRALKQNPYNRTGLHSDDRSPAATRLTRRVRLEPRNFGEFKVPSLRAISRTAPYMHNGSLATLADVVEHYSSLNEDRLHADGETVLRRLDLSPGEKADLVTFLETL
jgi:cytochrome c peroxidase